MPNMKKIKIISLVLPAYKQEKTIEENIKNLEKSLSFLPFDYEIIVVVDGFIDKTYDKAKKIKNKKIKIFGYGQNHGKGYAVRYGMLKAKGDIIGFIDAGMDINSTGISILLNNMIWNNADIVIGSKLHPDSKVKYPFVRKIMSWGYRTLIHVLFGLKIKDTQVGLKLFRRSVVKKVIPKVLVKQFAFDVEILSVANYLGFTKIYEGPIELDFRGPGSITSSNFWKVIFFMLLDTFAVFYRLRVLHYYDRK